MTLDKDVSDRLDMISGALHGLLSGKKGEPLDLCGGPRDEICQVAEFVNRAILEQVEFSRVLEAFSTGKLDEPVTGKSRQAQMLKQFQAMLKHMVWQTQQVARGDYGQRVDFLGGFSESFNHMVEQLESNRVELDRQMAELERLATTDTLTGLNNRRHFIRLADDEFDRWQRYGNRFAVLMFDLDRFKSINDTYGHPAGDEVLKAVAESCNAVLRKTDVPGRMGGEEFVVIFRQTTCQSAQIAAQRLREDMAARTVRTDAGDIQFTMSGGLVEVTDADQSFDDALKRADALLYQAKEGGRNQIAT